MARQTFVKRLHSTVQGHLSKMATEAVGLTPVLGCTDGEACNYNADATEDDGSCLTEDECGRMWR